MTPRTVVAFAAAFALGFGLVWLLHGRLQPSAPSPPPAAAPAAPRPPAAPAAQQAPERTAVARAVKAPPAGEGAPFPEAEPRHADPDPPLDPGDAPYYERHPMSAVPHVVVRGWGARGDSAVRGVVGVYVVVDPALSEADLERLARDIRSYHADADVLSVRILDSERAATYDRHTDGGALAAEHLVGRVTRNDRFELDQIEIRGRAIDPEAAEGE